MTQATVIDCPWFLSGNTIRARNVPASGAYGGGLNVALADLIYGSAAERAAIGALMAAAPELLAAAIAYEGAMPAPSSRKATEAWDRLRAAIAAATPTGGKADAPPTEGTGERAYIVDCGYATHCGNRASARYTITAPDITAAMDEAKRRVEARKRYAGKLDMSACEAREG